MQRTQWMMVAVGALTCLPCLPAQGSVSAAGAGVKTTYDGGWYLRRNQFARMVGLPSEPELVAADSRVMRRRARDPDRPPRFARRESAVLTEPPNGRALVDQVSDDLQLVTPIRLRSAPLAAPRRIHFFPGRIRPNLVPPVTRAG
jgi:hypothetical protein